MKILVISGYKNRKTSRPEAEIFIRLFQRGYDITIMSFGGTEYEKYFKEIGVKFIEHHPIKKYSLSSIKFIRKTLKEGKYDIIHLFNGKAITNGLIASMGLPVKTILYRGYTGNIHWYNPESYMKFLSPRVDKIICIAEATRDLIRSQRLFGKSKAVHIKKGHDLSWYADVDPMDLSTFGISKEDFVVVCSANARKMKGIPYLIRTMGYVSDFPIKLILLGNGMDRPEINKEIKKLPNKQNIIRPGFRDDVLSITKSCDIFALSSLFGEATTKAAIEAMSLGVTPVITDIPGNRGLVVDKECGLVVQIKRPKEMADAFLYLYKNRDECKKMGENAKLQIKTNFNIEDTVEAYIKLYDSLMIN